MTRSTYPPAPEPLPVATVDSHCHLDIQRDGASLSVSEALAAAAAVGVTRVVQIGCDLDGARWAVEVARQHASVVAGVALHPNEAPQLAARGELASAWSQIERLVDDPLVRAVGETGLDHFRTGPDGRMAQEESFRWHIDLAKRTSKALVIHDRDAHEDVMRVLDDEGAPERVVFHCFSGDVSMARRCVERGWYLSFAGTVTFANATQLRKAALDVPLELMLVETDAPYLTPVPYRGRPNASYLVPLTVRALAKLHDVDVETLASATDLNATRVFRAWGEPTGS